MTFAPYTIQDNERLSLAVARVHKIQSSLALDLVQRSKTLPKGAATFVGDCLARDSYMLTQHNRDEVTAELLGIEAAAGHKAVSDLPEGSDNRALVIALALVLGSLEARTGKDAWRHPAPLREPGDDRIYYGHQVTSGELWRFLAVNGYTLSSVEQVVTGTRTSDEVYDEYQAQTGKE